MTEEALNALVKSNYLFEIKIEHFNKKVKLDGQVYVPKDNRKVDLKQGIELNYGLGPNALSIIYASRLEILTYWIIALTLSTLIFTILSIF